MATKEEICYYDSDNEYDTEYVRDYFNEGEDAPEEGTREWYERIDEIRSMELDDLRLNIACSKSREIGPVIVKADYTTRYPGFDCNRTGYARADLSKVDALFSKFNADGVRLWQDAEGLHISAYHHDGSYTATVRRLNKKGEDYLDRHGDSFDACERVFGTKGLSRDIKKPLF